LPPEFAPRNLVTRAAYRRLLFDGLAAADAAGVIGYAVGLAHADSRWSLVQINKLLFLRELYANTNWGRRERRLD